MSLASEYTSKGAVAVWWCEETSGTTMVDSSGNGHDGTVDAAVGLNSTAIVPNRVGGSWDLDAIGEGGQVTTNTWINGSAMTALVWVKFDTLVASPGSILIARANVGGSNNRATKPWYINVSANGSLSGRAYSDTAVAALPASPNGTVAAGTLYLVAIRQDASNVQYVVNGVQVATAACAGGPVSYANSTQPITVGRQPSGLTFPIDGKVKGAAYFTSFLSDADLLAIYNAGIASSAQTISVGVASRAATALAVTALVGQAVGVGVAQRTSEALAVTPLVGKTVALGVAERASQALAITPLQGQQVTVGVASRTAEALPLTSQVGATQAVGVASRTATALPITATSAFTVALGVASRAAEALAVTGIAEEPDDGETIVLGVAERSAFALPIVVDPGYSTAPANATSGRQRDGIATWVWSPAVVDYPAHLSPARAWVTAIAFDTPTITNGRPIVSVTTATEVKARHRILIGGVDVTFLRGVPTPEMDYQLVSPGLYGPGSLLLPQVYGYMESPGEGDLSFLTDFAPIVQQRVDADGNVVGTNYKGFLVTYDIGDDGLRIETGGELTGRLALDEKQIPLYRNVYDLGRQWYLMCKNHGVAARPVGGPVTGIEALAEGGSSYLDAFNRVNAFAATTAGVQYTTTVDANGLYRFEPKDQVTIDATYYPHDGQQPVSLRRDLSEEPNMIYGTGVTPSGIRVLNAIYPDLTLNTPAPPYPKGGGGSFGVGTTDAETVGGDGITVMVNALHVNGFLDAADAAGGYDDDVAEAIESLQERAGLTVTGDMNQATWRALWNQDITSYSMRGSQILPMAQDPRTRKFNRGASGAIRGVNPLHDPSLPRVALSQDYQAHFRKPQMIRHARRKLAEASSPNFVGEMSFETGALIRGEHTPGDPIADLMSADEVVPGMNIWCPLTMGGILLHVSGARSAGGKITAQVDTRCRDAITVAQIVARNYESRRDLYRAWIRNHLSSGRISDAIIEWSEAGGKINDVELRGGEWNVFPVVSGRSGTVGRIRLRLNGPTEFYLAVFGQGNAEHIAQKLERRIGDPSTTEGRANWQDEDVLDQLDRENILLYVAGEPDDPCGYWPHKKSENGADFITGKWQDDSGFEYRTGPSNVLWVAVWPEANAKIPGGRIMWPLLDPGS